MSKSLAASLALFLIIASAAKAQGPSQAATAEALARIKALDRGPTGLNAVIATDPAAMAQAKTLDARSGRGPLYGQPVLLKDNIDAKGLVTTAGSLALVKNRAQADAPLAAGLRAAGMVILGKTNLSEWANFRSSHSISGWSAVGGLVRNPHVLDRSACGSSAGSAAAVAAGYVRFAVGTETDGSIACPAAMNGVVGLKPTVGLVSQMGIVPISSSQDAAGPITRTVADAAALLTAMSDMAHREDYAAGLKTDALKGKRLGVLAYATGYSPQADAAFARGLAVLKRQGAELVTIDGFRPDPRIDADEGLVLRTEFKAGINAYLAQTPPAVTARSLDALIAFDAATRRETALFGQETFEAAAKAGGLDDQAYLAAKAEAKRLAGPEGIDALLARYRLDALIAPTTSPAWRIDSVVGDNFQHSASGLPAVAGYPHLTVPMGLEGGLPVGLSFIGPAWSEGRLLALGYAYEQARGPLPLAARKASVDEGNPALAPPSSSRTQPR